MHLSVDVCFDWLSVSYSCGGACAQQDKRGGATGEICSMPTVQRWRMGLLSMHMQRTQQNRRIREEAETVWPIHWNDYVNKRLVWQIILRHPRAGSVSRPHYWSIVDWKNDIRDDHVVEHSQWSMNHGGHCADPGASSVIYSASFFLWWGTAERTSISSC